jgi:DNA-binding transcriptional LysR family regulator
MRSNVRAPDAVGKDPFALTSEPAGIATTIAGVLGLRRLRYFLTVAEEQNFTRAAERLHVAQPALSRQLRLLEEDLGVELMRRTTHTFELTDAGAYLLEHGRALLAQAEALDRNLRSFAAGHAGRIVVAYGTSAAYDTAPRLLAGTGDRLPDLDVVTRVHTVDEITRGIGDGTIDVGIVRCPPTTAGVESWLLRLEAQGVLVRDGHPLAEEPEVAIDQLDGETILLHHRDANPGHYDAIVAMLERAGVEPRIELRDLSVDLQQTPVLEGRAVAIVGESTHATVPPSLTWVPLRGSAALEIRLLARTLNRTPAVDAFLAAAQAVADDLGWRR